MGKKLLKGKRPLFDWELILDKEVHTLLIQKYKLKEVTNTKTIVTSVTENITDYVLEPLKDEKTADYKKRTDHLAKILKDNGDILPNDLPDTAKDWKIETKTKLVKVRKPIEVDTIGFERVKDGTIKKLAVYHKPSSHNINKIITNYLNQ